MAYPKEQEHDAYQQYVIEAQANGQEPLSKEEWRKQMKNKELPTALTQY